MYAVECKNIDKSFGKKQIFENLSVAFKEQGIYALLGRNGAGKTTLLRLMATQYLPNGGEINIDGEKAYENENALKKMCFMTETLNGFNGFKISKIFSVASDFYENWDSEYANRLCECYQIDASKKYQTFSKGQQTAINMIIGMASGCPIVLFDEIYAGMDPVARQKFYDILIEDYQNNPRTFIISTHLIDEMSQIFTDVVMIDQGKIILTESVEELQGKAFKVMGRSEAIAKLPQKSILSLKRVGSIEMATLYGDFDLEMQSRMVEDGLEVSALSLQELLIAMTSVESL